LRQLRRRRPAIEQLANELADPIAGGEEVDIVAAMTTPLPVTVIARMMGAPEARRADFKRWSNAALLARFGAMERGQGPSRRLPGGILFGFQSLPVAFR
jgi:cytochrome P450